MAKEYEVSLWGDKTVLVTIVTTLNILKTTDCVPKWTN